MPYNPTLLNAAEEIKKLRRLKQRLIDKGIITINEAELG